YQMELHEISAGSLGAAPTPLCAIHKTRKATTSYRIRIITRTPYMIDVYYWTTPNGHKITMFLEEAGLAYSLIPINIGKGEQFSPDFLRIAPNNRIPAIVDREPADGGEPIAMFESGAILLYLAEKTGKFIPTDLRQ